MIDLTLDLFKEALKKADTVEKIEELQKQLERLDALLSTDKQLQKLLFMCGYAFGKIDGLNAKL